MGLRKSSAKAKGSKKIKAGGTNNHLPTTSTAANEADNGNTDVQKYRVSNSKRSVILEFSTAMEKKKVLQTSKLRQLEPPRQNRMRSQSRPRRSQSKPRRSQSREAKVHINSKRSKSQGRPQVRSGGLNYIGLKGKGKNMQGGRKDLSRGITRPEHRNVNLPRNEAKLISQHAELALQEEIIKNLRAKQRVALEGIYININDDSSAMLPNGNKSTYDPRGEIDHETYVVRTPAKPITESSGGDDDWVDLDQNAGLFQRVQCRAYYKPRLCAMEEVTDGESHANSIKGKIGKKIFKSMDCRALEEVNEDESHANPINSKIGNNLFKPRDCQPLLECTPVTQCHASTDSFNNGSSLDSEGETRVGVRKNGDKSKFANSNYGTESREDIMSKEPRSSESDSRFDGTFVNNEDDTRITMRDKSNNDRDTCSDSWFSRAVCANLPICNGTLPICNGTSFEEKVCNQFDCGDDEDVDNVDKDFVVESSIDESKVLETSEPTVLYATIGSKNWNGAICRLLEAPDEASVWVDTASSGDDSVIQFLPLHIACLSSAPLLLVTLLIQTFPEAVKKTSMGQLPIHMACGSQTDHRIVFLLLNSWPESLHAIDDEENTPIEVASLTDSCKERAKIIQVLTHRMDNVVVTIPTALYAAIDSRDWNYAIRRLVEMPQEATMWVSFMKSKKEIRFLPLHAACLLGAPLLLVADLIEAYPFAVRKKTVQGQLPLHIACAAHCDCRVVSLLLESWSDALHVKDIDGNTAFESASQSDMNSERKKIIAVLDKQRGNAELRIEFSPTELYSLIEAREWDAAVKRLLEAPEEGSTWVGSCMQKENAKILPLHLACMMRAPLLLVAVLIQAYPDGIKKKSPAGKLPIHFACEKRADHRVISLLLYSWPESFHARDKQENTCVQSALLSQNGKERTKNLETLIAFEARFRDPSSSPLPSPADAMEKYAKSGNDASPATITTPGFRMKNKNENLGPNVPHADVDKNKLKSASRPKSNKKSFFGRKKKKPWNSDSKMFAE